MLGVRKRFGWCLFSSLLIGAVSGGEARGAEVDGSFSLSALAIVFGGESRFRLSGRLQLDLEGLLGSRGKMSIDMEGRRSGGVRGDSAGLRAFRLEYDLVPDRVSVQVGRLEFWELEGLLLDGMSLRWKMRRGLSLELVGGSRPALRSPYGTTDLGRLSFGALLRSEGPRHYLTAGFSELRSVAGLERRAASFSGRASLLGRKLSVSGQATVDLGQAQKAVNLTSLYSNLTFRPNRRFDVAASFSSTTAFVPDAPDPNTLFGDLPQDLWPPQDQNVDRFGQRRQTLSLRGQISPLRLVSIYGDWRRDMSESGAEGPDSWGVGAQLRFSGRGRTRLKMDLSRSLLADTGSWRVRGGLEHRFGQKIETEVTLSRRQYDAKGSGLGFSSVAPKLGVDGQFFILLNRRLSLVTTYGLELQDGMTTHVATSRFRIRF